MDIRFNSRCSQAKRFYSSPTAARPLCGSGAYTPSS